MLQGPYRDHIAGDVADVLRAVSLIANAAQHEFPRSCAEWLAQPARWIAAYEFLLPFVAEEIEAKRERETKCHRRS